MASKSRGKIIAGVIVTFLGFAAGIGYMAREAIVTPAMALLMLVALFGLYVGFGILFLAYRLVNKLD